MDTDQLITRIIDLALEEDGPDVTSEACFSPEDELEAEIRAKEDGIVAGLSVASRVFLRVNPDICCQALVADGDRVSPGMQVMLVRGPAVDLLKAERVALNFMQRMSGIATRTALYVAEVRHTGARLLDTRKTAPGQRVLDKMAVLAGGGENHRMGLADMAMLKDNHLDRVGSIADAVHRVREHCPGIPVEVEARTLDHVRELLPLKVDRIMIDNFALDDMREAVRLVDGATPLEASGGVNLQSVRAIAETGVDYISVGDLTHSVRALDLSMTMRRKA